jgi:hypothetical protein
VRASAGEGLAACAAVVLGLAACAGRPPAAPVPPPGLPTAAPGQLLAPAQLAVIADRTARSQAMFVELGRVLTHPRCVNCHPPDDTPRQGEAGALHDPPVLRGADDRGIPALGCTTCHQDRNAELARIPGAPDWHLAPRTMVWLGKTPAEICVQLKDPARNGGRTLAQVADHLAHDAIVAWGWQPGADRAPVPGTQAQAAALVQAWIETGAACPAPPPAPSSSASSSAPSAPTPHASPVAPEVSR